MMLLPLCGSNPAPKAEDLARWYTMASKYKVQPGNGVEQDRVESGIYAKLNDDNQEQRAPSPEGYRGSLEFTAAQDRMRLMQNAQSNPGEMVTLTDAERDIISGTVVYNKQVGGGGGRDLPSMRDLKIVSLRSLAFSFVLCFFQRLANPCSVYYRSHGRL